MNDVIRREFTEVQLSIAINTATTSAAFDFRGYAGGQVIVPAVWTDANIGFYVSPEQAGTYVILRDDTGAPVQISGIATGGARAYNFPPDVFASGWVKLWSKSTTAATETDTNQAAARALTVLLKG